MAILSIQSHVAYGHVGNRAAVFPLERLGYEVIACADAVAALSASSERVDSVRLLISDVVMPGVSGWELAGRIRERLPLLPVLFMSGYTSSVSVDAIEKLGHAMLLPKPFTVMDFSRAVRALIDGCSDEVVGRSSPVPPARG